MTSADGGTTRRPPTLTLEGGPLRSDEVCYTAVFDEEIEGEYRVVQLSATQSFDSLRDALDVEFEWDVLSPTDRRDRRSVHDL